MAHDEPGTRTFYRIIGDVHPVREDFLSDRERGMLPPRNPEKVRYWEGLSVFETLAQARDIARKRRARAVATGQPWQEEQIVEGQFRRMGL